MPLLMTDKMKYLIILISLLTPVQAEYFYLGIGAGKNDILFGDQEWIDGGEIGCSFRAGNRHHLAGSFYGDIGYSHYSQCLVGPPVNDDLESSSDHLYYWVEWRFGE